MAESFSPMPEQPELARRFNFMGRLQGILSWTIVLFFLVSSLTAPGAAAIFVTIFLLYFLSRSIFQAMFLFSGFFRFWVEKDAPWMDRLNHLGTGTPVPESAADEAGVPGAKIRGIQALRRRIQKRFHRRTLMAAQTRNTLPEGYSTEELGHMVIMPVYREGREVTEPGIAAIAGGNFPASRVALVLACEEKSPDEVKADLGDLQAEYRDRFSEIIITEHPFGLPGEIPGKASNEAYAARKAAAALRELGWKDDRTVVTVIDADAIPHENFLVSLSYQFLTVPDRHRCLYQPLPVFDNNLSEVPPFIRMVEMLVTVLELVESTSPSGAVTFSSYSISLQTLEEVGYWPTDVIAEDAALYWRCYLAFNGNVQVISVPSTISMDSISGNGIIGTFKDAYAQKLRWAYGAELIPPVLWGILNSKMGFFKRIHPVVKLLDTNTNWVILPFLLNFGLWMPRLGEVLLGTHPIQVLTLMIFSPLAFGLSGIFFAMLIATSIYFGSSKRRRSMDRAEYRKGLPKRFFVTIFSALEWVILLPVATILLSAVPALHAQTILMFGKRLAYVPAAKHRPGAVEGDIEGAGTGEGAAGS